MFDRSRVGSGNAAGMEPGGEEGHDLGVPNGRDQRKWPGNTRVAAWDTQGRTGIPVLPRQVCCCCWRGHGVGKFEARALLGH